MTRKILLVGASGTLGGQTLSELLRRGADVRALVRASRNLPGQVEQFIGDLGDRSSLDEALNGVQAAYYVSPHEADEVKFAENFIQACEAAGVRIVFAGIQIPDSPTAAPGCPTRSGQSSDASGNFTAATPPRTAYHVPGFAGHRAGG